MTGNVLEKIIIIIFFHSISAEIQQEGDQFSLEARCPAPYPATKPYIYLIKNKLERYVKRYN